MGAGERNEFMFIVFLSIASNTNTSGSGSAQVLFNRNSANSPQKEPEHSFPAQRVPLSKVLQEKISRWLSEQSALFEASCVALSAHILAFPLIWFMGWALPWPKAPEIVTIIEINLENWPNEAIPESVTDIWKTHVKKR